jgi:chorismate mutase
MCTKILNKGDIFGWVPYDGQPLAVQEIDDNHQGDGFPCLSNPVNRCGAWIGLERITRRITGWHHSPGFLQIRQVKYRNAPLWQIPIELRRRFLTCLSWWIQPYCGERDLVMGCVSVP